ncbi:MAG: hypothetical protein FWH03_05690 [Firmicutes bacterium]|nr:hypothetical protein [Bacillota bacterium]
MEYFLNTLYGFLTSLAMLAPIFLFGFLIALLNRTFYRLAGRRSRKICYATGFIGTPVHELAHASMCLLFGHKITEIKLFQVNSEDGVLGYVRHSYNKRNLYHRVGNFFIGIAPIVMGSLLLVLLMFIMANGMFYSIAEKMGEVNAAFAGRVSAQDGAMAFLGIFAAFFRGASRWLWWLYLLIAVVIALHMNLSKADIKGSKEGFFFVVILLLLINAVVAIFGTGASEIVRGGFLSIALFLFFILLLSLFFASLWVLGALLVRLITLPLRKNRRAKSSQIKAVETWKSDGVLKTKDNVPSARTQEISKTQQNGKTRDWN